MRDGANNVSQLAVYTLRIERDKLDALRKLAAREHRTLSQELRWMIDERLKGDSE